MPEAIMNFFNHSARDSLSIFILIGFLILCAFFAGRIMIKIKLPTIIGFMVTGAIFGPSLLNIINDDIISHLSFIPEIVLGFVALNIGLELNLRELKKQGMGMILTIFTESIGAFILVFLAIWLVTKDFPLSLIFASIAPASAPAGTVAVIREYRAKGKLTQALYTVVGFDDGLGIMIFGISASIAKFMIISDTNLHLGNELLSIIIPPLKELFLSCFVGFFFAMIFCVIARRKKYQSSLFIFVFAFILIVIGLCDTIHLSLILSNMVFGLTITNTRSHNFVSKIDKEILNILPLFFILFFSLAGANLHINELPSLGLIGVVYIFARSGGLIGGAYIGCKLGKLEKNIRKYLGLGILSQAGVAIGLSMIVKNEFSTLGKIISPDGTTEGAYIGSVVLTTVTATCIFFEIIGPITTRIALMKSGEIKDYTYDMSKEKHQDKGLLQKKKLKRFKNLFKDDEDDNDE